MCFLPLQDINIDNEQIQEQRKVQVLGLMAGSTGLLAGLFLLDREPLFGVLGMLGAMALLLGAVAKLCKATERNEFVSR
jgi:hypothetical protein